jgi:hypothetical protein
MAGFEVTPEDVLDMFSRPHMVRKLDLLTIDKRQCARCQNKVDAAAVPL